MMKKNFFLVGMLLCALGMAMPLAAQNRGWYLGMDFGTAFGGLLEAGEKTAGVNGVPVRSIDLESGGAPVGIIADIFVGYKINKLVAVEVTVKLDFGSAANTVYASSANYTSGHVKAHDQIEYRSGFVSFDAAGVVDLMPLMNPKSSFIIAVFAGAGVDIPFRTSSINYGEVGSWTSSYSGNGKLSQNYDYFPLSEEIGPDFFIKTGMRLGYTIQKVDIFLNGQVMFLPFRMSDAPETQITKGGEQRTIKATMPRWISPSITLGGSFFIGN